MSPSSNPVSIRSGRKWHVGATPAVDPFRSFLSQALSPDCGRGKGWLLVRICIADAHGLATFSHMKKIQSAAIPFRLDEANRLTLLLITSRRKGRWVLPKGTVSGMLPHASAAREAFEEAGVIGSIAETPFETYYLRKKVGYGAAIEIPVHTFPMRVTVELQTWPEMDFRQRRWILAGQITEMVESEELRSLLQRFAQSDQARLKA